MMSRIFTLIKAILITLLSFQTFAQDPVHVGRLGIGISGQLQNDIPAVSFKFLKSRSFALGGLVGFSTNDNSGGFGGGIKLYRNIFEEPNLVFYCSLLGALTNRKQGANTDSQSGFQFDLTLGSEFHFQGLRSLGFSFETGISLNKETDFNIETVGQHFIVAALHFYL